MEFLWGLYFAGKPPLASRNVICFLKLVAGVLFKHFQSFFFSSWGRGCGGGGWLTIDIPTIGPSIIRQVDSIVICNTYSLYTFVWDTNMAAISKWQTGHHEFLSQNGDGQIT